ncbi:hypothetical protein SD960_02645 [Flavobacterium sp. MMLR14_040]|uniref:hypothetical protein n=1 Tax=Flavobacterium sp. MMLR14_040 TaxID=3093843 RepID=UPI000EB09D70|nr:hypothetical protein [Flavobacterium sp. MMLR14_040]MDW8848978.1 hypothetical protein [Flavobacterium sp. MMLR14_040]
MENNKMFFKIKKNNLFGYFPLNKEPKYKTLEKFQDNFARFQLPNGQKGWIDLTGERIFGQLKLIQMKTNLFILLL